MSVSSGEESLNSRGRSNSSSSLHGSESSSEEDEEEKRVRFAKVFAKEFSAIDPARALNEAPEFPVKDIGSTSSISSFESQQPGLLFASAPEILIEASVGILAQTATSEFTDLTQRFEIISNEDDNFKESFIYFYLRDRINSCCEYIFNGFCDF